MGHKVSIEVDGAQYYLSEPDEGQVFYRGAYYNRVPDGMRLIDEDVTALAKLEVAEEHFLDALYNFFHTLMENDLLNPEKKDASKKEAVNDLELRGRRYTGSHEAHWDAEMLIRELAKELTARFA